MIQLNRSFLLSFFSSLDEQLELYILINRSGFSFVQIFILSRQYLTFIHIPSRERERESDQRGKTIVMSLDYILIKKFYVRKTTNLLE